MAKRVSPGHLQIKDESLGVHPKKAILKVKSKNSKTDPKRGGKKGALNDSDTPNKKSPQPEASWKKDINSKTDGKKGGKKDALNDSDITNKKSPQPEASWKEDLNSKTDGKKGALNDSDTTNKKSPQPEASEASWKEDINIDEDFPRCMCIKQKEPSEWMQMRMNFMIVSGLPLDYQLLREEEEEEHRISNQEQIKVPGSPQCPSLEPIDLEEDPEEDARWLEWTSAAWRVLHNADIARSTRSWMEYETNRM